MKKLLLVLTLIQLALLSAAQNIQQSTAPPQEAIAHSRWDAYTIIAASFTLSALIILVVVIAGQMQKEKEMDGNGA